MKDVVDNEILNKDEMKLGNQTSFARWYDNEYTNDFKDCLDDCLESAKKERKDKDRQVDDEQIHKEALQKCTLRNWDKLQVFFLPFSYKKKQQILKIYQQAFLNNDLLDDSKLRTALSFNGTQLPYLDIENKNFLNLMNQGTILEKTLYWFSNLCCCTGNNSDVDVNLTHINDNGKIM